MRTRNWPIYLVLGLMAILGLALVIFYVSSDSDGPPTPTAASTATTATVSVSGPGAVTATAEPVVVQPTQTIYTVVAGDTLGAIALTYGVSIDDLLHTNGLDDPNVLHIGQELVIPPPTPLPDIVEAAEPAENSTPLPTALPTPTPIGPPVVEIARVLGSGRLAEEAVTIRNRGGTADLTGWTLSDEDGNTYAFPGVMLFTDGDIVLRSTSGDNTPRELFWGRTQPAWNGGELLQLRDATGALVDSYIVP
ncbi:MAG: LysM peptidoglycan-binding domain-containing protein [Chloroflexi bacterium]|nr:LysM peptidoglycan-binding domain-containing protein [Chloroflexota bacterium]